jgi:hypothetical protein
MGMSRLQDLIDSSDDMALEDVEMGRLDRLRLSSHTAAAVGRVMI